jgi:hypothetical protein
VKKLIKKINRVDCFLIERNNENLLILVSKRGKVFNPTFTFGIIAFIASMIFKANVDADVAAIPLGISTLILISGVWILSGVGKIVFNKSERKIYCIYSHLGYLQKIYVHSLSAVDEVVLKGHFLFLRKDTGDIIIVSKISTTDIVALEKLTLKIRTFIER